MANSFPQRLAAAMMAMISSAASLWRDHTKKHQGEWSHPVGSGRYGGGNKHAKRRSSKTNGGDCNGTAR